MSPIMYGGPNMARSPRVNIETISNGWVVEFFFPHESNANDGFISMVGPAMVLAEATSKAGIKAVDSEMESWKPADEEETFEQNLDNAVKRVKSMEEKLSSQTPKDVTMVFEKSSYAVMMETIGKFLMGKGVEKPS